MQKRFRVLLNGENFLIKIDGREQRCGFYTTRVIEAATKDEAKALAIDLVRSEPRIVAMVRKPGSDDAVVSAEEVEEVGQEFAPGEKAMGLSIYLE
jgi:hypothetical protein